MKMTSNAVLWTLVAVFFASLFALDHNNMQYTHFNALVLYLLAWAIVFSSFILHVNRKK